MQSLVPSTGVVVGVWRRPFTLRRQFTQYARWVASAVHHTWPWCHAGPPGAVVFGALVEPHYFRHVPVRYRRPGLYLSDDSGGALWGLPVELHGWLPWRPRVEAVASSQGGIPGNSLVGAGKCVSSAGGIS